MLDCIEGVCVCGGWMGGEERMFRSDHQASSFMILIILTLNAEFLSQLEEEGEREKERKKNEVGRASN